MAKRLKSHLMLLSAALIWGCAFVAQSVGMEHVGPWTFTCLRSFLAGFALLLFRPFLVEKKENKNHPNLVIKAGIVCGIFLTLASIFQQYGIQTTTVGKAGFITTLYVIFVPMIAVFLGKKISLYKWIAVFLALAGLYFLSMKGSFVLARGDFLVVVSALFFAWHILVIDYFIPHVDGVTMSCVQFFVVGILCLFPMLYFEHPAFTQIQSALIPILYAGLFSSAIGYTLQILGQKNAEATVATILLSLESVFAAIAGYFLLHETLSQRELFGCALLFMAMLIAQGQKD
ncbi:MAG: DMT family transporter [Solobacterium sp.]|nr:DMT family transporter [Solobacterium sp.]